MISVQMICPCGSQKHYTDCCNVYHQGAAAPTARLLMPSRYSAYVLELREYLLNTWHASTRLQSLDFDKNLQWLTLELKQDEVIDTNNSIVEFITHYKIGEEKHTLHEFSRFIFEDGRWYYIDGVFPETEAMPGHRHIKKIKS